MHPHVDPIKIGISIVCLFRDNPIVLNARLFPLIKCGFLCQKDWYQSVLKTCTTTNKQIKKKLQSSRCYIQETWFFFKPNKKRIILSNILKLLFFPTALLSLLHYFWMCVNSCSTYHFLSISTIILSFGSFSMALSYTAAKVKSEYTEHGSVFWKAIIITLN